MTVTSSQLTSKPPTPTHKLHDVDVAIVPHPSQRVKYTKQQLYDIIQVVLKVNFFMAQHGEKGTTLKAFGNGCHKLGIKGGDIVLKDRMLELLAYHNDPEVTPKNIHNMFDVEGNFDATMGSYLKSLVHMRDKNENKLDEVKEKQRKKSEADAAGGLAIRQASLNTSHRKKRELRRSKSPMRSDSNDADVSSSALSSNDISIITGPISMQLLAKDNKENLPISSKGKSTVMKKHCHNSDSEPNSPHPRNMKCIRSFNIQAHLEAGSSERKKFQDELMAEVKEGNHIVAESVQRTADFQDSLLKVFTALIPPAAPQN